MRALLPIALLVLASLPLAGCGDDEETTTPATTTTPPAAEVDTAPAETQAEPAEDDGGTGGGGSGNGSGGVAAGSAGADPRDALEAFFVSGNPDLACGEIATERLVASAYGDEKGCRQAQVPAATPDAIEIQRLETSGDSAEAVVVPHGGPNDGIETEVTLVRQGETWRLDSLEADVPAGP